MRAIEKERIWKCVCCNNHLPLIEIFLIGSKGVLCIKCFNNSPARAGALVEELPTETKPVIEKQKLGQ